MFINISLPDYNFNFRILRLSSISSSYNLIIFPNTYWLFGNYILSSFLIRLFVYKSIIEILSLTRSALENNS
jgi:hypothetical protein